MIIRIIVLLCTLFVSVHCAHAPRCGNLEGAKVILEGKNTCTIRIRQVEIGSELKIPESLKKPELTLLKLAWIDPVFADGQIIMGHFKLIPKLIKNQKGETE